VSEGETRPERLFVYLVPAEREAAEDPLRFYGGIVDAEGKIALHNLASGRYWILAEQANDSAPRRLDTMRLPDATATRAQLRRDAETAKTEVELKPCDNVTGFRLTLKSPR
jgi:hypothetical protein